MEKGKEQIHVVYLGYSCHSNTPYQLPKTNSFLNISKTVKGCEIC